MTSLLTRSLSSSTLSSSLPKLRVGRLGGGSKEAYPVLRGSDGFGVGKLMNSANSLALKAGSFLSLKNRPNLKGFLSSA